MPAIKKNIIHSKVSWACHSVGWTITAQLHSLVGPDGGRPVADRRCHRHRVCVTPLQLTGPIQTGDGDQWQRRSHRLGSVTTDWTARWLSSVHCPVSTVQCPVSRCCTVHSLSLSLLLSWSHRPEHWHSGHWTVKEFVHPTLATGPRSSSFDQRKRVFYS